MWRALGVPSHVSSTTCKMGLKATRRGASRRVTELLDEKFEDLPRFEDAVTQFLERSSEMRMNFRESTSEVKGDHATVIVDAEMIYTDKARPAQDQRRRQRIQFDFVYNPKKGWRIFEITPRQFFEP